jgi:chromosome segregation ATPase
MHQIKSLRTLAKLLKHRASRLETALREQQALLTEKEEALRQAQANSEELKQRKEQTINKRSAVFDGPFCGDDLIGLDLTIQNLTNECTQAEKEVKRCEMIVAQQQIHVDNARREVRRNEQRQELMQQRILTHMRERDQAQEDTADEEAEETASARFVRKNRDSANTSQTRH